MPRKSKLFPLAALSRAYRRNLGVLARAAKPLVSTTRGVRAIAAVAQKAVEKAGEKAAEKAPRALTQRPSRRPPRTPEWVAGIAPGPAGARRFHLFVPVGLAPAPGELFPLLVMLHGCGQTGSDLAASSRMNRLAARKRFLVLYPEQERVANTQGCWNWFERRSGKADAEAATLLAAVDQVARRHPVDLGRVAVAGLSAGGSMAALLGARYPSRFCAVVMHSGVAPGTAESAATAVAAMRGQRAAHLPPAQAPAVGWASMGAGAQGRGRRAAVLWQHTLPPLMVLHGDADSVVSLRNAAATAQLWTSALGARPSPPRTLSRGRRYPMRATDFKVRGHTVVSVREVAGLGHAWSGGAPGLPYSDPAGPDASALAWAFIAKQWGAAA